MVWVATLLGTVAYADQPRPIVQVVTPDGVLQVVPGNTGERWGIPAGKSGSDDKVTVEGNEPPVLEPLSDQEVDSGETVKLQATAYDPDGDELTYAWQQDSGPRVPLNPSDQSELSFKAPTVQDKTELVLMLSVSDTHSTVSRRAVNPGQADAAQQHRAAQRSRHPAQPVRRDLRRSGHRQPQSGRQPGLRSGFGRQRAVQSTAAAAAGRAGTGCLSDRRANGGQWGAELLGGARRSGTDSRVLHVGRLRG